MTLEEKRREMTQTERFKMWLLEFSLEPVGTSMKNKTVYADILKMGRTQFARIKKVPDVLHFMKELNIEYKGNSFYKVAYQPNYTSWETL
ncbi:hypothetical protein [Bacillus licheniformis]|uniref:hypothetical protein n=1 Tax=Bacillus licheniformis TaxID=1402 RepID=UPI002E210553|nr:hypothetical protein [Bacillus licheniformis]